MKNINTLNNRTFKIVTFLIQILLILGIYLVDYYSKRKMGFMRYLVYLNQKLENLFLNESFKTILLVAIVITLIFYIYKLYKTKKTNYLIIYFSIVEILVIKKIFFNGLTNNAYLLGIMILLIVEFLKEIKNNR
ncbi:MAG: hypothetical protein ACRC6U_07930 [Fusobacteriaceae bacterium]